MKNIDLKKKNLITLFYALILGLFYDLFFYGKEIGISYPIYIIFVLSIFILSVKEKINTTSRLVALIPVLLLSSTFTLYSNEFLLNLNKIVIPLLFIYTMSFLLSNNKWYDFKSIFSQFFNNDSHDNFLKPSKSPALFIKEHFTIMNKESSSNVRKVLIGILISLPILIFVISLLSSADSNFSKSISSIPNFLSSLIDKDVIPHLFLILIVSFLFSGILGIYINSNKLEESIDDNKRNKNKKKQDYIIVSTILIMINIVYLLFVVIQFSYLFGDSSNILTTPDLTYADYAIKGFNELVIVAVINFSLLLFSIYFTDIKTKLSKKILTYLLTFLSFNTLVILYSGYSRLHLYQEAYGYTQRRITVYIFMFYLLVLVLLSLWKIFKPKTSLFKNTFISSMAIYIIVNFINVDSIIATNNIDRYFNNGKIDLDYFEDLSNDAIPELKRLSKSKDKDVRMRAEALIQERKEEILNKDYWQSYKFSDSRILDN